MTKSYNPSEILEFVTQGPAPEQGGQARPAGPLDGEPPQVVVVGFKVPFADLMLFSLKLMLAAVPVLAAAGAAVYLVAKFLPKLL